VASLPAPLRPLGQVGDGEGRSGRKVAKGPKPRSALSAEATKAAQPSRCCSTEAPAREGAVSLGAGGTPNLTFGSWRNGELTTGSFSFDRGALSAHQRARSSSSTHSANTLPSLH
jgi:hypothetical protein